MLTTIWTFIQPYVSNVFVWIILALIIACGVQTTRYYISNNEVILLTVKLDAANDKLAMQKVEFEKLKALADAQDIKLKQAYKDNIEIEKLHAKTMERIISSRLPDTASCEDVAKWARDIAKRRSK
jgi:uncharacterized membrane protein